MPFDIGDDVEIARQLHADLAGEHPQHLVEDGGALYLFRETGLWQEIDDATVIARVMSYSGQILVGKRNRQGVPLRLEVKASRATGALKFLKAAVHQPGFFAEAPAGVPFQNGFLTIDQDGGTSLVTLGPEHRARFSYPFDFQPKGEPQMFLSFLRDITSDKTASDQSDYVRFTQEYFGASLVGAASGFERIVFAVGGGGTGNSTLPSIITGCMPDGSWDSVPPSLMDKEFNRISLKGILLNWVDDLPHDQPLASGFTKSIASGQPIEARHLYQRPETFRPRCGTWLGCNRLPPCLDVSEGWRRRSVILQFTRRLPDEKHDRSLRDTILDEERPMIVSWLIEGAARAIKNNVLTIPTGNAERVDRWVSAYDNLGAYVRERLAEIQPAITVDEKTWLKIETIYPDYLDWTKEAGIKNHYNRNTFARELSERVRRVHNEHGSWYAVRLRIQDEREKAATSMIEEMN